MIKATIFDMDGLLINSEPLWQASEYKVFLELGVPLKPYMFESLMGRRIDEVVDILYSQFPWQGKSKKETVQAIIDNLIILVRKEGKALKGVVETLKLLKANKYKIALASSSYFNIIDSVLDSLNIREYFDVIHSAEIEEYGKPHPQIFISTARMLNVKANECVVFEDSLHGVIAALAANMKCIAIPDLEAKNMDKFIIADKKISSLSDFKLDILNNF